jgi:alcohol dehydrogenase (cytochrome c)
MRKIATLVAAAAVAAAGPCALGAQVAFTRAQADAGAQVYAGACASCHGTRLDDGPSVPLAGAEFQRKWSAAGRSLEELYHVTRTTMPRDAGGTLPNADYVAVLAYLLDRNGYAAGAVALTGDSAILKTMRLSPPLAPATGAGSNAPRGPAPDFIRGAEGLAPKGSGPTHRDLIVAPESGRDWLTHTRDYAGTRYSPLAQVNTGNVATLRAACLFQVGESGNFQTGPVVHDGTMYLTTLTATIAIDAATCRQKWRHSWQVVAANLPVNNRGVAIKDGRVIRGTTDGYLIALDAQTGTLLWARRAGDAAKGETFTMAPLVYDSLVYIGVAVSELAVRGWVGAFRADNGERVWRFNIVPAPGEPGSETWKQSSDLPLGGGAVWTPVSLDAANDLLYVAAANPAPDCPESMRGGINLYTNSLIALHARTGKLAWYDQMVPNDDHDWDMTQASPLYRARVNGQMRNLVATAGKDGVLRVVDRDSKRRVFETPVTTLLNVDAPVTTTGTHACPGIFGGVQWNGPSFHPGANVLVTPAVDWCTTFYLAEDVRYVPGQQYLGGRVVLDSTWKGWLTAVDASTGAVRWKYASRAPMIGAVTTTAGGLALAGELGGDVVAFNVATGAELYRFNTGGAIGGGLVTYEVAGTQYIAVASGRPSSYWARATLGSPTIVVFALPPSRARE